MGGSESLIQFLRRVLSIAWFCVRWTAIGAGFTLAFLLLAVIATIRHGMG